MLLLELDGLIASAAAVGNQLHEGIEEQMPNHLQVGYFLGQQRSVPGHHPRALFGDVVGDEKLLGISLIHVDHPIERIVVNGDGLLPAEGNWAALEHVVHLSEALENLCGREVVTVI